MSPTALVLVLSAALLHAVWNLAAKSVTTDRAAFIWLYVTASAVLWVPIAVLDVVLSGEHPGWGWLLGGAVTAVLHIGYQFALQRGYAEGELNLVYPLARGSGPLLTVVVALAVLGERPGLVAILGVVAILAGIALIAIERRGATTDHGRRRAGVVWGVLTGAAIASYTLWDNFSVHRLHVPPTPYFVLGIVLQLPWLTALVARSRPDLAGVWRETWHRTWRPALVIAVLSPLAYVLVLHALLLAPVALVAPARESSIMVGAVFGWLVLKEPRPGRRLAGAVVVLGGIALIALG